VGDVANFYDINPLYKAGINGRGQTVGIATLANFLPSDAYAYWSLIGLIILPNRITQVHVDGGGELSADAGSGETSLDVEQSGGLAPNAKIIVYDAPNTNPGIIDLFYKAASDNLVDSLSVSRAKPRSTILKPSAAKTTPASSPSFARPSSSWRRRASPPLLLLAIVAPTTRMWAIISATLPNSTMCSVSIPLVPIR
jgi:subtilase family serine protease